MLLARLARLLKTEPENESPQREAPNLYSKLGRAVAFAAVYQLLLIIAVVAAFFMIREQPTWELARALLMNWDARHYLSIARDGYQTTGDPANFIVFFPLFPTLISMLSCCMPPLAAAFAVTTISSIIGHALWSVYLSEIGLSPRRVLRCNLLLLFYPAAVYFTALYTEALYLAVTAATLLLLQRERYLGAAATACACAMTRSMGLLIVILFLFQALKFRPFTVRRAALAAACGAPLGFGVYLLINYLVFGDPFHYNVPMRENWHKQLVNPFLQYYHAAIGIWHGHPRDFVTHYIDVLAALAVPIITALYVAIFRRDLGISPALIVWTMAQWALIAAQSFWLSSARYVMLILPIYPMLERLLFSRPLLYWLFLALSAYYAAQGVLIYVEGGWLY